MLILTGRVGESILLGDSIEVTVVAISPGGVRLGFDAPKSMNIIRGTLKEKLQAAGKAVYTTKGESDEPNE